MALKNWLRRSPSSDGRLQRLARNPVLMRELEVRAARDEGSRAFNYAGPGLYLLLLQLPVLYGLLSSTFNWTTGSEAWTAPLFLVTVWLQVLYFSHAAARFCAGCMAVERERGTMDALRLVPFPAREVYFGKYLAAIAPLLVEAVLSVPFMLIYAWYGAVSPSEVFLSQTVNLVLILFFGAWGMYESLHSRDVSSAVSRAFCTVACFNIFPLVLGGFLRSPEDATSPPLALLSPLCLMTSLVHARDTTLQTLQCDTWYLGMDTAAFILVSLLLYRACVRRLSGR